MEKVKALWKNTVESFWFLPGLFTVVCAVLALVLVRWDSEITDLLGLDPQDQWWLFGGSPSSAMSVLESVSMSIMTVTGVVFSVVIIALQLASNQYTPRVLRQFMADRGNQLTLGVFIGTFTYALLVLRAIRTETAGEEFIPSLAVTVAVLLTLTSLGFLIYFINHVARSMQAPIIIDTVANDTLRILREVYPRTVHEWTVDEEDATDDLADDRDDEPALVRATEAGYVQALERGRLLRLADEHDLHIRMDVQVGTHMLPGEVVMRVWPGTQVSSELERRFRQTLVLAQERTPHQDLRHGMIELMDIAIKALSPAINDVTTAINVIHRQAQVLLDMAWRESGPRVMKGEGGKVRVVVRRPDLNELVGLAYDQIRHYGSANATLMIALMDKLADLAALTEGAAREAFVAQLDATIATARQAVTESADRGRLEDAIARAMETSRGAAPRQRPHMA